LSHVTYTVYELEPNGTYRTFSETQVNRYFLVQEMSHWLDCSGFTPIKWFAGFSDNENVSEQTWHVVAVARRSQD
jgi:hypothetical protein